ncbi:MAG: hypothetical protein ABFD75_01380 [Smithella sp.]
MGEIKSAIELAMERTRHLSLSEEEKVQQHKDEFEKLLQGALQRYSDEVMSVDEFRERISELQSELHITDHQLVIKAVLKRIDPDQDNERWMNLLSVLESGSRDSLQKILLDYLEQRSKLLQAVEKQVLENLAQQHGITGSAIVPNPDKNASYQHGISVLKRETQTKIDAISLNILK